MVYLNMANIQGYSFGIRGPKGEMFVHLGARFTPCMRPLPDATISPPSCLNAAITEDETLPADECPLEEICGFGGFGSSGLPGQMFRCV